MDPIFETLPKQKLAYLILKKCGCSSIIAAFKELRNESFDPTKPTTIHNAKETDRRASQMDSGKGWYSFTLVRDPIRRFLSFYSNKILSRGISSNRIIESPDVFGYQANMSLDDAIDVTSGGRFESDMHAIRQTEVIDGLGFDLDFIGRFEDFENSIARVTSESSVRLPVFHLNKNRRIPRLVNATQFDKLTRHYHEDQERFGYPTEYQRWCELNVNTGDNSFQTEQGFVFADEAILLDYQITRQKDHFAIDLSWQVHANHSRSRCIRVVEWLGDRQRVLHQLPKLHSLMEKCDEASIAKETVKLNYADIPSAVSPEKLSIDIYFWDPSKKNAELCNFNGASRVILPLPVKKNE